MSRRRAGFRDHGTARGDDDLGGSGWFDQSVAACDHLCPKLLEAEPFDRPRERSLVDRASRQSEVQALAIDRAESLKTVAQQPVERLRVRRFDERDPRKLHADGRGDRALVRSTLWRQGHARRRAGDDEASPVVEAVDQGIQAAAHERVVDGPDRKQMLPMELMAEAEGVQHQEQVHLADPQLDVLPVGGLLPAQQTSVAEIVRLLLGTEHAHLVDPATEVRRHADIWGRRDQAPADFGFIGQRREHPAERLLGRHRPARDHSRGERDIDERSRFDRLVVQLLADPCAQSARVTVGRKAIPLVLRRSSRRLAELGDLLLGEHCRVVQGVARDREPPALDRVGEHDARSIGDGVTGPKRGEQCPVVVPSEVLDQTRRGRRRGRRRAQRRTASSAPEQNRSRSSRTPAN